jgi:phenolic acid decarboxylase
MDVVRINQAVQDVMAGITAAYSAVTRELSVVKVHPMIFHRVWVTAHPEAGESTDEVCART